MSLPGMDRQHECVCVCEFSDGKGWKEEKRWVPEKGGIWGPERLGNRHSGPQLDS